MVCHGEACPSTLEIQGNGKLAFARLGKGLV